MTIKVRNWTKFQHFKDRRPPWVKLYRDLLDDKQWHSLDGDSAKALVMLWLLASEDSDQGGALPDVETIAFRLRITESKAKQSLTKLSEWLIHDDIKAISSRYHDDAPETETETETELLSIADPPDLFDSEFWPKYPRREAKPKALSAFRRLSRADQRAAIDGVAKWQASGRWADRQYIPQPATYLNQRRWEDEITSVNGSSARGFVC